LASLLHSVAGQQQQQQQPVQQAYQYGRQPHNAYAAPAHNPAYANNQATVPVFAQPPAQQSVQDMLAQLAKYRQ
jgi:hypothetical protein